MKVRPTQPVAVQLAAHSLQLAERFERAQDLLAAQGWGSDSLDRWGSHCAGIAASGWHSWTSTAAYIELCTAAPADVDVLLAAGAFGQQLAEIVHEPATQYFNCLTPLLGRPHRAHQQAWQTLALVIHRQHPKQAALLGEYFQVSRSVIEAVDATGFLAWIDLVSDSAAERIDTFRDILARCRATPATRTFTVAKRIPARLRGSFLERSPAIGHWSLADLEDLAAVLTALGHRSELARDFLAELVARESRLAADGRRELLDCCRRLASSEPTPLLAFVSVLASLPLDRPGQVTAWVEGGLPLLQRHPEAAKAYYALESATGIDTLQQIRGQIRFSDQQRLFDLYSEGISGRRLQVRALEADTAEFRGLDAIRTDGRHIYLPDQVSRFDSRALNLDFYRVCLLHQLGFFEAGTFDAAPPGGSLQEVFDSYRRPELAATLFQLLEDARVDWYLLRRYAGIRAPLRWMMAEMLRSRPAPSQLRRSVTRVLEAIIQATLGAPRERLAAEVPAAQALLEALQILEQPAASVADSLRLLAEFYPLLDDAFDAPLPAPSPPEVAQEDRPRTEQEVSADGRSDWKPPPVDYRGATDPAGVLLPIPPLPWEDALADLLTDDLLDGGGQLIDPANVEIESFLDGDLDGGQGQTLTDLEKPLPAGKLESKDTEQGSGEPARLAPAEPFGKELGIYRYDEWDHEIGDYRRNWCRLQELRPDGGELSFVEETLQANRQILSRIRRQFQMLRPELQRKVKGLLDGEEIDLEAAIEAVIDRRGRISPRETLYIQRMRRERDVAALFLLDMSASTDDVLVPPAPVAAAAAEQEQDDYLSVYLSDREREALLPDADQRRIIDLEKESVILMAEALQELGDHYAICGFSGYGREQVDYFVCKDFDEKYDQSAKARIAAIKPCRSTRMGTAIRHATRQLAGTESRVKTLIILSDGYPQDFDYGRDRGSREYGIQDTTKALTEARQKGIQTFCLTVDPSGHDYLREMCPDNQYMVIRDLAQLPSELSRVYEGLTT